MRRHNVEIDAPAVPGIRAGLIGLVLAAVPLLWLAVYLLSAGMVGVAQARIVMLSVEPYVFVFSLVIAGLFILFALIRNRRSGKVLALVALGLAVLEVACVVTLIATLTK